MEATTPPTGPRSHEFGSAENDVIGNAGRWIGYWSWIAILSGILMGVGALFTAESGFGGVIMGAVYVVIGVYFRGAAASMKSVVATTGSDVEHLMTALEKLSSAFKVMVLLVFLAVVLALVVGILSGIGVGG